MISFDVLPLPENESSEAAVTCDLLPLPEEKFTVHRIEWAGCNYCTWKCHEVSENGMYHDVPQNAQNGFRGFPSLSGGHHRQTKSLRYSFSQHIVGLVVVLEIWLLNRNSTPLFNASLVLPKHWSKPHATQMFPKSGEKIPVDSSSRTQKVARSSEASKCCTHPLLNSAKHKELPTKAHFSMVCFWT